MPPIAPTSFISEHTAEFILAPRACAALRTRFRHVAPFFFWASREGSYRGSTCGPGGRPVRLASIFARRPKIIDETPDSIFVRLNPELFKRATASERYGIPVYAGVPFAKTLEELGDEPQCLWFRVHHNVSSDIQSYGTDLMIPPDNKDALSDAQVAADIEQASKEMTWEDAVDALRGIREEMVGVDSGGWWSQFGGYKPFHVVAWR